MGTRNSFPPPMFIVPPEESSASSPLRDTEASVKSWKPRTRDSGLVLPVRNSRRRSRSHWAVYRIPCPSGAKRAPSTCPRRKVSCRNLTLERVDGRATKYVRTAIAIAAATKYQGSRQTARLGSTGGRIGEGGDDGGAQSILSMGAIKRYPVRASVSM